MQDTDNQLPLHGLKVLEFTHAVMGPTCGLLLADMGAEVIHIEPPQGDSTRYLKGFGTGYFPFYSRNKKSLAIDLKATEGKKIIQELVEKADILVENFGPGTMDRLGYGYDNLSKINEKLIYCSLKGFLSGPYEQRHAMDEVVQMMGGLAYMTGPVGMPLRAGTSIVDITGGMFGFIGILLALYERNFTGKGKFVKGALFETTSFLMGQHMAYSAISKTPVPPMPARVSAWSVYRVFDTLHGEPIFIGIISDKHWEKFCEAFGRQDLLQNPKLKTNNDRISEREWLLPDLEKMFSQLDKNKVIHLCEKAEIPFAPIARPEDLFEDAQLNEGGSLLPTILPDGTVTKLPKSPLEYGNVDFSLRMNPPKIGEHTDEILHLLGYDDIEIAQLKQKNIIL
ncbi:MAG: CoA transferase [Thermoflexibacter sp.]|jgi:crotonobetainyl-CoA:carnitine CoA-transferase CaiB-like acyl-CoA transferase|nr:CoA transferase [Thermoflexibacter sp.]